MCTHTYTQSISTVLCVHIHYSISYTEISLSHTRTHTHTHTHSEPSGYSVVSLSEEGQWFLEIYLREVNIDEKWVLKYQAESVEIVSMAIHVLDITTADVYYINGQDKVRGKKVFFIFYFRFFLQLIYRRSISNVNSNATTTIVFGEATPIITCCLATPQDLAVDWLGRNLYWTDSERGVIEVGVCVCEGVRV